MLRHGQEKMQPCYKSSFLYKGKYLIKYKVLTIIEALNFNHSER